MKLQLIIIFAIFFNFWADAEESKSQFPPFEVGTLFHHQASFPEQGRITIVSFFSPRSTDELFSWIEVLPLQLSSQLNIRFINILFPGGIFFMIPRKKAYERISEQVQEKIQTALEQMSNEERGIFEQLEIYWVADLDKNIFKSWGLDYNDSWFFLFDEKGKLVRKYSGYSNLQSLDFQLQIQLLNKIKSQSIKQTGTKTASF
jgi:hypothetical protein